MIELHLTEQELETTRQGMTAFLNDFGHDEADTVARIRSVLARLDEARLNQARLDESRAGQAMVAERLEPMA